MPPPPPRSLSKFMKYKPPPAAPPSSVPQRASALALPSAKHVFRHSRPAYTYVHPSPKEFTSDQGNALVSKLPFEFTARPRLIRARARSCWFTPRPAIVPLYGCYGRAQFLGSATRKDASSDSRRNFRRHTIDAAGLGDKVGRGADEGPPLIRKINKMGN